MYEYGVKTRKSPRGTTESQKDYLLFPSKVMISVVFQIRQNLFLSLDRCVCVCDVSHFQPLGFVTLILPLRLT